MHVLPQKGIKIGVRSTVPTPFISQKRLMYRTHAAAKWRKDDPAKAEGTDEVK